MLPERPVWVFNGRQGFPSGVFTTRERAEVWITERRLSGVLTAYPIDEGTFDWALRVGAVTGRARTRGSEPEFVASFSSAVQDHYHYVHGIEGALPSLAALTLVVKACRYRQHLRVWPRETKICGQSVRTALCPSLVLIDGLGRSR